MKKVFIIVVSTLVFFGLNSFTKNDDPFDGLISIWIPSICKDGGVTEFIKGERLEREGTSEFDGFGIQFEENGGLIVRQEAGMCGSGPISFGIFPGSWEDLSYVSGQFLQNVLGHVCA